MTNLSPQAVQPADQQQPRQQAALATLERIARQVEAEIEGWARHAQSSNGFGDADVDATMRCIVPPRTHPDAVNQKACKKTSTASECGPTHAAA